MRWTVAAVVMVMGSGLAVRAVMAQDEDPSAALAPGSDAPVTEPLGDGDTASAEAPDAEAATAAATQDAGNVSAIDDFMNNTNATNLKDKVESFYAKDARYEDPFGSLEGRDALLAYYKRLFAGVDTVAFEIKEEFVSGDETVALWTMKLQHHSLRGGDPFTVDGASQYRFAGNQVVSQHNYFDAGALVYENVTFVGMLVRWVKKQVMPGD